MLSYTLKLGLGGGDRTRVDWFPKPVTARLLLENLVMAEEFNPPSPG